MRYLRQEEFGRCRPLWEEAFPEDSRSFGDYYFKQKLPLGRVAVREDPQGQILSMAHLNPYQIQMAGACWELDYLVGVATRKDQRHRGMMREILTQVLRDEQEAGRPFCYLMPASPDIYRPFDFAWIFDQPRWEPKSEAFRALQRRVLPLDQDSEDERLAVWMNGWLSRRFEVYARRSPAYVALLRRELASEEGVLLEWLDDAGETAALQAFWGTKEREQRLLYSREDSLVCRSAPDRPAIMARITRLEAALSLLRLRKDCPQERLEAVIEVRDDLLPENEGRWQWRLDREGSSLRRMTGEEGECGEVLSLDIARLTSWMFGYCGWETASAPEWTRWIQTLQGVFLDEVV